MKTAVFWIRWIILVPVFVACWQLLPEMFSLVLRAFHYDLRANSTQTIFVVAFADTFLTLLIGTALAPSGKLLVALVAAAIMSMPSIYMLVVVAFMRTHFGDYDGHGYQYLNQMMCVSASFFLGAISSFILIVLVLRVRHRRIHCADS